MGATYKEREWERDRKRERDIVRERVRDRERVWVIMLLQLWTIDE